MADDRIRNVYTFKHVTGEQFYDKSLRDKRALVIVELDGMLHIYRQSDLEDEPETVDTNHLLHTEYPAWTEDQLKHNLITEMINLYLNKPNLRILQTPNTGEKC